MRGGDDRTEGFVLVCEQIGYNLLFRWFVGLAMDTAVWDVTVFTKNRERLLASDVAAKFLAVVVAQAHGRLQPRQAAQTDGDGLTMPGIRLKTAEPGKNGRLTAWADGEWGRVGPFFRSLLTQNDPVSWGGGGGDISVGHFGKADPTSPAAELLMNVIDTSPGPIKHI